MELAMPNTENDANSSPFLSRAVFGFGGIAFFKPAGRFSAPRR
jgi:hypothetical protein